MTRYGMTPQQAKALAYIRDYIADLGISPSFREIADHLGLVSAAGPHRIVNGLAARGHLRHISGSARSITLVEQTRPSLAGFTLAELQAEIGRRVSQNPILSLAECEQQYAR